MQYCIVWFLLTYQIKDHVYLNTDSTQLESHVVTLVLHGLDSPGSHVGSPGSGHKLGILENRNLINMYSQILNEIIKFSN